KEWGYASVDELRKNTDLDGYVRQQMVDGRFEPVAKYLYVRYINFGFSLSEGHVQCPDERAPRVSFSEVRVGLARRPQLSVSDRTRRIIEMLAKGRDFLEKHCQKSPKASSSLPR